MKTQIQNLHIRSFTLKYSNANATPTNATVTHKYLF